MRRLMLIVVLLVAVGAGAWFFLGFGLDDVGLGGLSVPGFNQSPDGPVVLTMDCSSVGREYELCVDRLEVFMERTGYRVIPKPGPTDASLHLSVLQELSLTRSQGLDVYAVDVIWPGILADDLLDLREYFSPADLSDFFPAIVENNTVGDRLVAIPYYTDAGLLYYRTDLLERYGFGAPPATWAELEEMAQVIQAGERAAGNDAFWGFVWQGRQNEGLTCDALEWFASEGAGSIVEIDGTISATPNNQQALAALSRAQRWVGTISPDNSPEIDEEASRAIWQSGNAAFMRNWPYAYALGNSEGSPIRGLFDVGPLPSGEAGSAATLGGWQLAVSRYSRFPDEAAELVRFMTGTETQKYLAIEGSYNPTRLSLYSDPDILAANPFFGAMLDILNGAVARPSTVTGADYEALSTVFHTQVNEVLRGETTPEQALRTVEQNLVSLRGDGW